MFLYFIIVGFLFQFSQVFVNHIQLSNRNNTLQVVRKFWKRQTKLFNVIIRRLRMKKIKILEITVRNNYSFEYFGKNVFFE